jgi:hypothetical protein
LRAGTRRLAVLLRVMAMRAVIVQAVGHRFDVAAGMCQHVRERAMLRGQQQRREQAAQGDRTQGAPQPAQSVHAASTAISAAPPPRRHR